MEEASQQTRHIGVEIEYSDVGLPTSAEIIRDLFGGHVEKISRYVYAVKETCFGDFHLEVDADLLKKIAADGTLERFTGWFKEYGDVAELMDETAAQVVPFEIAAPPIPVDDIGAMDKLASRLRKAGALGTTNKMRYAFGVHLNIEMHDTSIETILRIFRAFLMLRHWLSQQIEVDFTRKLSPFIDAFPNHYTRLVMDPAYHPDQERFIRDYLEANPTRNRALDLLPLLGYLDEELVRNHLPEEKINARPTLHYRLPNSKIDLIHWRISDEWEIWQSVEKLAQSKETFETLQQEYMRYLEGVFSSKDNWIRRTHQCMLDLL